MFWSSTISEVKPILTDEDHDKYFKKGSRILKPYMQLLDTYPKVTKKSRLKVLHGIEYLDAVTKYNSNNWAAFWIKGKGYQFLGDHVKSNLEFKVSYQLEKNNPDVAREYSNSCLDLGDIDEAIKTNIHAITIDPKNAGLHANLAVAYLLANKNELAVKKIKDSLSLDPYDEITILLEKQINEVINGKRKQPVTMSDLEVNE